MFVRENKKSKQLQSTSITATSVARHCSSEKDSAAATLLQPACGAADPCREGCKVGVCGRRRQQQRSAADLMPPETARQWMAQLQGAAIMMTLALVCTKWTYKARQRS